VSLQSGQLVISREAEFVVGCVSAYVTGTRAGRVAELAARDLDWELLARIATWHAVAPILHRALSGCPELVPEAILADLRQHFRTNAMRNTYLASELVRLTSALREKGVPVIAFKGPLLAQAAYGDLGLREFIDLDILVPPSDLGRSRELLFSQGYRSRFSGLGEKGRSFFQWCEEAFEKEDRRVCVDVHWQMNPQYFAYAPEGDVLWRRMVPVELQGAAVNTLSTSDLLLHLCVHGAKHGWTTLGWICDVAMLARSNPGLEWPRMMAEATSLGGRRLLLLGLYLAHDLLGAAVPDELISMARDDEVTVNIAGQVKRRMFDNAGERASVSQEWMVPIRAIESIRARVRYVAGRALSPTVDDWELVRLPRPFFPLYYLLHPVRLAVAQGPRFVRDLIGRFAGASPASEGA
jgi:putative nucleotidyltransferase-like protein